MIWKDNLGNDLTWAIGLQMEGKLNRTDVEGIIKTHEVCNEYRVNGKLYGHYTSDGKLTNKYTN
jgi:hypothetical protein|tara:strand:+ start:153 stop:344 length:192 start_codon:yes stop_codon:yes gene_type:complete